MKTDTMNAERATLYALAPAIAELRRQFTARFGSDPKRPDWPESWFQPVERYSRAILRTPDLWVWANLPLRYGFRYLRKAGAKRGILLVGCLFFTLSIRV